MRTVCIVLAALVTATGLTAPAQAVPQVSVQRFTGGDRYATAASMAEQSHPRGASTVLVASGEAFPDALAATSLAGSLSAPVVLARRDAAPAATLAAVRRLAPSRLVVVGGTARISDRTAAELVAAAAAGATLQRIAGADRYATAALVAAEVPLARVGDVDGLRTAFLATGERFPDALAAGPVAAALSLPLLLAPPGQLPPAAGEALVRAGISQVVVLGGEASVSPAVERAVTALGISTVRLGGSDRQATAAVVADWSLRSAGFDAARVALARGDDAGGGADALAMGPLAALRREPVLLAAGPREAGRATTSWVAAHGATLASLDVAGGEGAISPGVVDAVLAAAGGAAPTSSGPGSLAVAVAGLPAGVGAAVSVSGPGGYYASLTTARTLSDLPTGTYRVVASPVALPGGRAYAVDGSTTVEVSAGATARAAVDYGTQVPDSTKVAPAIAVDAVQGAPGGRRVVTLDDVLTPDLAVGDVVVAAASDAAPAGVLGRVVAAPTDAGAGTAVTLEPVDLREAVPVADFEVSAASAMPDTTVQAGSLATATTREDRALGGTTLAAGGKGTKLNWVPECGNTGGPFVKADLDLAPTFHLDADWGPAGVDSLDVGVDLTGTTTLSAGATSTITCSVDNRVPGPTLPAFTFTVGPVPVVLVPRVDLDVAYGASTTASVSVALTTTTEVAFGRRWSGGTWTPYSELGSTYAATVDGGLTSTLSASAGPRFTLLLYGVAGPELGLRVGAEMIVNDDDPVWAIDAKGTGQAGLAAPVFGMQKDVGPAFAFTRRVAQASAGAVTLGLGGRIGDHGFYADADEVVPWLDARLGPGEVLNDSQLCNEDTSPPGRVVAWGPLTVYIADEPPSPPELGTVEGPAVVGWSYFPYPRDDLRLRMEEGIGVGSSAADVRRAYPGATEVEYADGPALEVFLGDLSDGTFYISDTGQVTGMAAGHACHL